MSEFGNPLFGRNIDRATKTETFREVGDNELPVPKKTLRDTALTPGQFSPEPGDEALRAPALVFLRKFISETKLAGYIWPPGKILRNPDVLKELKLKLGDKDKTKKFPWSLLPELLEALEKERKTENSNK